MHSTPLWHNGCNRDRHTKPSRAVGTKIKLWRRTMKKTITAITLAMLLSLGSNFAKAEGILVADRSAGTCTNSNTTDKDGIIVFGRDGIIVFGRDGIIVFGIAAAISAVSDVISGDAAQPCSASRDGILVSD